MRSRRRPQQPAPKPRGRRLLLEQLEDRTVPSTFTASTVSDLIADINAANLAGGSNTILLAANTWFTLTGADNSTDGGNGLPLIAAKDNLSIIGQGGDTISAVTPGGVNYDPAGGWRCLDVASGAALTLSNLTVTDFQVGGSGGAIYNEGSLVLNAVTINRASSNSPGGGIWSSGSATLENGTVIQSCVAGSHAADPNGTRGNAYGGGIWSSGTLTVTSGVVIENNSAVGGAGAYGTSATGGNGFGGGIYIAGGTANLTGATINSNSAKGGEGGYTYIGWFQVDVLGPGGNGYGGGLYAASGANVTLCSDTVEYNAASGGAGVKNRNGKGDGGGLFIANKATFYLDSFTLANIINNTANHDANIDGSYLLKNC
jgi:hypothetical protein